MNFSLTIWERCISAWHWALTEQLFLKIWRVCSRLFFTFGTGIWSGPVMQNFFSNLAPSGGEEGPNSGAPWWMKYAGKAAGIGGGLGKYYYYTHLCLLPYDASIEYWLKHKNLLSSGRIFRFLVLHYLIALVYSSRYLADMCWPFCHNPGSSILLYVLGFCSKSSGQSWRKTNLAEGPCVPRVRNIFGHYHKVEKI